MGTAAEFNEMGKTMLPGYLGIEILDVQGHEVRAILTMREALLAPNGFLHAASVIALADTAAGYGCRANLPAGASGFTTIELKSNHLGTAREGVIECLARAVHLGKTTQVWDCEVTARDSAKTIALYRCTQMILYPKT
ncbi:thioesterase [Pseudomonas alcaligenes]|uniref:Thioesterase n=1 Tax=Aquipseudomonas alcaligenes TaxID=43263 RepID=A0ABR7S040_AQUAC|nr:PaaI family thioesterase [Pseudomonas alcaligenes]MBC9250932.1 thioesterase [Pseudomonas alcaligenes]